MPRNNLAALVADRTVDAELGALLWLLVDGGVPIIVTGLAPTADRQLVAASLLAATPSRAWILLDGDDETPTTAAVSALLQGEVAFGITLEARDLAAVLSRLGATPDGLPEDGLRRLGVVIVTERVSAGLRLVATHYLRPTERDAGGHLQRRPPAVLATWDPDGDTYEHFAWGITPELADRVDRSQADLEERQASRAAFLAEVASTMERAGEVAWEGLARGHLAAEPARQTAPQHAPARPSPFHGGLIDPDPHVH